MFASLLQTAPTEIPTWQAIAWAAFIGVGGFIAAQVWPVWRDMIKEDAAAKRKEREAARKELQDEREDDRQWHRQNEERRIKAWETIAHAEERQTVILQAMDLRLMRIEFNTDPRREERRILREPTEGERGE